MLTAVFDGSIRVFVQAAICLQILQSIPRGVGPIFQLRSSDEEEERI